MISRRHLRLAMSLPCCVGQCCNVDLGNKLHWFLFHISCGVQLLLRARARDLMTMIADSSGGLGQRTSSITWGIRVVYQPVNMN